MEEKSSVSRVKKSSGVFTFRIEGYSGLSTKVGESTESPEFDLCGHTWQLRIFPGGSLDVHRGYVSYYLASKSTRSARASYKLSVSSQVPGGTDECFMSSGVRLFEAKGVQIDGWGRDKFTTVAMLQDPDYGYCINDSVIFRVEITVYGDLEAASFPAVCTVNSSTLLLSLSRCMKQLVNDEETADIMIRVYSGEGDVEGGGGSSSGSSDSDNIFNSRPSTVNSRPSTGGTSSSSSAASSGRGGKVVGVPVSIDSGEPSPRSITKFTSPNWKSSGKVFVTDERTHNSHTGQAAISAAEEDASVQRRAGRFATSPPAGGPLAVSTAGGGGGGGDYVTIYAHKCILAARSPVFKAMLVNCASMTEAATGVVTIDDVDAAVMRECLVYMYTDECSNAMVMDAMAEALLCAACKYQIATLSTVCETYLCNHITVENVLSLLRLADMLGSTNKLKESALQYAAQHGASVLMTKEFSLLDGDLLKEVTAAMDSAAKRKGCGGRGVKGMGDFCGERRFATSCVIM